MASDTDPFQRPRTGQKGRAIKPTAGEKAEIARLTLQANRAASARAHRAFLAAELQEKLLK